MAAARSRCAGTVGPVRQVDLDFVRLPITDPHGPRVTHLRSIAISFGNGSLRIRSNPEPPVVISDQLLVLRVAVLWTGSLKRSVRPTRHRSSKMRPREGSVDDRSERLPRAPTPRSAPPATERLRTTTGGCRKQPAGELFGRLRGSSARMACWRLRQRRRSLTLVDQG